MKRKASHLQVTKQKLMTDQGYVFFFFFLLTVNNTWARGDMEFLFECSTRHPTSEHSSLERCREYLFVYYINISLTRSRLNSRFIKRTRCHLFMALNEASDVSAADWLSQTHMKNYRNFSRVVIRLFLVEEIPIKHSSLYNKYL